MKVWNKRDKKTPPEAIYVGRPTKWGNPFPIGHNTNRAAALRAYEEWIKRQPDLMEALPELKGKDLVCWCAPKGCHADILMRLANPKEK